MFLIDITSKICFYCMRKVFLTFFIALLVAILVSVVFLIYYWKYGYNEKKISNKIEEQSTTENRSVPSSRRCSEHELKLRKSRSYGALNEDLTDSLRMAKIMIPFGYSLNNDEVDSKQSHNSVHKKMSMDSSENEDDIINYMSAKCRLWLSMHYDSIVEILTIKVIKAINIPHRQISNEDPYGLRDCFIKIFILPEERLFNQTKIVRKSLHPKFSEVFHFHIMPSEINNKSVRFTVYDVNKKKLRFTVGHTVVGPLNSSQLSTMVTQFYNIDSHFADPQNLGELDLSLMYQPDDKKLRIFVKSSKNIRKLHNQRSESSEYNVYVKITSIIDRKVCQILTSDPQVGFMDQDLNQNFNIDLNSKTSANEILLIISLILSLNTKIEQEYGRVTFGNTKISDEDEALHWNDVISNPEKSICRTHKLKSPFINTD